MPDVMNIKKIDIHAHATANPAFTVANHANGYRNLSAEELLAFYERLNIEKGVLLPLISPESQWDIISNQDCKLITEQYPEHFFWFCSVDPRAGGNNAQTDLTYILQYDQKLGAKGVGELTAQPGPRHRHARLLPVGHHRDRFAHDVGRRGRNRQPARIGRTQRGCAIPTG